MIKGERHRAAPKISANIFCKHEQISDVHFYLKHSSTDVPIVVVQIIVCD